MGDQDIAKPRISALLQIERARKIALTQAAVEEENFTESGRRFARRGLQGIVHKVTSYILVNNL